MHERDRFSHLYLLGRTGTGKSTLLKLLALQDILAKKGIAIVDPHGDLVRELVEVAKPYRSLRVLSAAQSGFHFNPLLASKETPRPLLVASILSVFEKLWEDSWGPRLEHLLRNVLYTLTSNPGTTLAEVPRLLAEKSYRNRLVRPVRDLSVRQFWFDEYAKYSPGFRSVVVAPLQNKLGALLTDYRLRVILTAKTGSLDLDAALDQSSVLLFDLSKGQLGEGPSALLGGFLTAHLTLAGLARSRMPEEKRAPFFIYLDEYPSYATSLLATALSELRKYRVGLILAHQYLAQLDRYLRDAALGNVGSLITFRVGAPDAPLIARELLPRFDVTDLVSLPNYMVYTRLMIAGQVSKPFSFRTYADLSEIQHGWQKK